MKTQLDYGQSGLELDLSGINATIMRPSYPPPLAHEQTGLLTALNNPIGCPPLLELIKRTDKVAIVIADNTRPLPSDRLLPLLLDVLSHLPPQQVTIIIGTGSHRPNTPEEIESMVGRSIARRYNVVNHSAFDRETQAYAGESPFGYPVYFNKHYVEADKRIIMGFIEPHFMAGFSGGYKAVMPGIANIEAILKYHDYANIAHPGSTWGNLEDNPTVAHIRGNGSLLPVTFCINVALDNERRITQFFCGETLAAHEAGCAYIKEKVMARCPAPFPVVVTTNSGYPLDQNLYQSVKGMSAAAQIVAPGGLILIAARCNDGFPEHGNFRQMLLDHDSPEAVLRAIQTFDSEKLDQWQAQLLAVIRMKARVGLYSELSDDAVRQAHLEPVHELRTALDAELARIGADAPVAVLPEGPLTIPYIG